MKTHFDADFVTGWSAEESVAPGPDWHSFIDQAVKIYLVRHPLDVMASYFQFLSSEDETLERMSLFQFLLSDHWNSQFDRLEWWARHVRDWSARPDVTTVYYEELIEAPHQVVSKISMLLQETPLNREPYLPKKVTSIAKTRLDRLFRLSPESTGIVAQRSRFPPKNWRSDFTDEQLQTVASRLGRLLGDNGYSIDRDGPKWSKLVNE